MPAKVIDHCASPGLIAAAAATWPVATSGHWHQYSNGKLASKSSSHLPRAIELLLNQMATIHIEGAFPDLEYLHGAGLHQMNAGTSLGCHLDTERHPLLPWRREATAILYIDTAIGGELELTDELGHVEQRIEPVAGRLIVFSTQRQWHQVAECRSLRRSVCLFFWSICDADDPGTTSAHFAGTAGLCAATMG